LPIFTFAIKPNKYVWPKKSNFYKLKNHKTNKAKILITIAGPTAVGKTDLTLTLAKKYNSHIISADSRQLYKELNIGTAKPSKEELSQVIHYYINHISIEHEYNVAKYEDEINTLFNSYFENHDIGILSGGTGMYIKAALEGLDYFPDVDEKIKIFYDSKLKEKGLESLQFELKERDPIYAQEVDNSNSRRLIRALSVIESSGQPYSSFLNQKKEKQHPFHQINICLTRDREELYSRINRRVDLMIEKGLLDEVQNLMNWQNLKSMQTVGYSELFKHINGEISLPEAIELIKRNSRRYAKRQMTWFRNQGNWKYINAEDKESVFNYIDLKTKEFG